MSPTKDHVVARAFFLEEDRVNLPTVPACSKCNQEKSKLEHYASTVLLAGSKHIKQERVFTELAIPRFRKNQRLLKASEILHSSAHAIPVGSYVQPIYPIAIDAKAIQRLMGLIIRGLYRYHSKEPLGNDYDVKVGTLYPDYNKNKLAEYLQELAPFCDHSPKSLGRDSFEYQMSRCKTYKQITVWRMRWHGGVALHGPHDPPQGTSIWTAITLPKT